MKQPGDDHKRAGYKYRHAAQHRSSTSSIEMRTMPNITVPLSQPTCPPYPTGTFNSYHPMDSLRWPTSSGSGVALGARAQGSPSDEAEPSKGGGSGAVGGGAGGGGALGMGMGVGAGVGVVIPPPEIQRILEEVSFIAQRFWDQDEAEVICSEWKFAAAVVDRLCLVAFLLLFIICTFTILMSAPNDIETVSKDLT